jgi:hypothetical protein
MKVAKFEIKMILALFLSCYDYELVDACGKPLKTTATAQPERYPKACAISSIYIVYQILNRLVMCAAEETDRRTVFPSVQED